MKNYRTILYLVIMMFSILFILSGCDNETKNAKKIAYISTTKHSQYAKTFTDLHLGIIYDFNLRLTEADKSWVTLWVEGYENGEKTEPFRLIELSYGLNPTSVSEGPMGLGIINPQMEDFSLFLYSTGASIPPHAIKNILNSKGVGATSWSYAIGDEVEGLEEGETKVLGVYRQAVNSFRTYDYQDTNDVTKMINEDTADLLLKIKVDRKMK
ncbi:hypothetical protein GQF01_13075 [Paenibacillus sp. 5J-6]|uniref:Uncharacterized protein n=1 Tax=Paenibacillus silvestris TaxID=2606219 RepID=A0A6L8V190_9BACL|nr:hypothetical protein [Paenibacillus silvestris]MZQ83039.1 hypothetical protein [Paenibacillus silvestris]